MIMLLEAVYQGPGNASFNQYLLEIILIIFGAFLLGYLFRFFLNDKHKQRIKDLEATADQSEKEDHEKGLLTAEVAQLKQDLENSREAYSRAVSDKLSMQSELEQLQKTTASSTKASTTASSPAPSSSDSQKEEDLTIIEGVGPKIAQLLKDGGIKNYQDVIDHSVAQIKEILLKGGPTYAVHDPSTWAEQSKLAQAGKIDELKALQKELKGGRRKS